MNNNTTNKKYFEEKLIYSVNEHVTYMLNDVNLTVIASYEDEKHIGFECKSKLTEVACNSCGCFTSRVKDRKICYPLIGKINEKTVLLKLHKKLFYCKNCKKSMIECPIDIEAYAQKSNHMIKQLIHDLREQTTYSIVARRYQVSVSNVIYHFDKYRESLPPINYVDTDAIAVDEVRFIPTVGNYQFVIMDHNTGNIIDILENRYGHNVKSYLEEHLSHIRFMSQDFWEPYKNAVKDFPQEVTIVADKFHLARFASWGFNRTRVSIQKSTDLKLGKSWKLQTKSRHKLDAVGKHKVDAILEQDELLQLAYNAKNHFFHILRTATRDTYQMSIEKWLQYIHRHELTEFYFIETTLTNWNQEILNMFSTTYSNGSIERINRTIKQAKNIAFGFKNLARATALIKMRTSA